MGALASLETLALDENKIGDDGLKVFAEACRAKGALASLRDLRLSGNAIGDVGLQSLAHAITPVSEGGSGALASLKTLYVDDGPLGTEHPALKAACQARGISLL